MSSVFRSTVRALIHAPLYSCTVVLTLAVAMAGTALVFAAVDTIALRPLPVRDPDRLVEVYALTSKECAPGCINVFRQSMLQSLERESRSIGQLATFSDTEYPFGDLETKEFVSTAAVSGNFFNVLGATPLLGRLLVESDGVDGAELVLVVSHAFWQSRLGGNRGVVGEKIALGGRRISIVGVARPGFDYPGGKSAWVSLKADQALSSMGDRLVRGVGRLTSTSSVPSADAEWRLLAERLTQGDSTQVSRSATVRALPGTTGEISSQLATLMSGAGTITLLALTTVLSLVLLRIMRRRREFSIRAALGADRRDVIRMALTEVGVLVVVAAVGSLILMWVGLRLLQTVLGRTFPEAFDMAIDRRALVTFVVVMGIVGTTLVWGYLWASARIDARSASRTEGGGLASTETRGRGLRGNIVSVQLAVVIVLCAITLSMSQLLHRAGQIQLGYEADNVVVGALDLSEESYKDPEQLRHLLPMIAERLRSLTGEEQAAVWRLSAVGRYGKLSEASVTLEGGRELETLLHCNSPACSAPSLSTDVVPEYFGLFGVPIVQGRGFLQSDNQGAAPVAILNELAAQRWWPGENPLGKHFRLRGASSTSPWLTVVGVARQKYSVDDLALRLSMAGSQGYPILLRPIIQTELGSRRDYLHEWWQRKIWFGVHTSSKTIPSAELAIREVAAEMVPSAGLESVGPLRDALIESDAMTSVQRSAALSWPIACLGLLIALIGLSAAIAENVRRSSVELAIRMALGASPQRTMGHVVGRGLTILGQGVGLGLLLCLLLNRLAHYYFWTWNGLVRGEQFSVGLSRESLLSPRIVVPLVLVLAITGLLATLLPAQWAASRNPSVLLREQ